MTFADQVADHQRRCQPHLLRLRILAGGEAGAALPRQVTAEVRDATNAIIAEAEAAGRAALTAMADSHWHPAAETFLWARLTRLAGTADEATEAARGADASSLRRHLSRFETLTAAIWTVQCDVCAQPPPRARPAVPSPVVRVSVG